MKMTAYAYFKLSDEAANGYTIRWLKDVSVKRDEIILSLQKSLKATGVSLSGSVRFESVKHVWFNLLPVTGWVAGSKVLFVGDIQLWDAMPDITTPAGREYAALIREHEEQLRKYPDFSWWLCRALGVDAVPDLFDFKSVWDMRHTRDGFGILFKVILVNGVVVGNIPAECQRIKHSEFVALTEE
ncbi:hypothetical protein K4I22_003423 [Escherichia coli]|nr:hypothetical protein [Escherichia coli]EFN7174091.1 hypothetical protein [Escherichia coli]EHI0554805.1 hypothetical protein [Escherichia coli]EHY5012742.1 hypothetical protein [Escherichia coli]ELB9078526.1 hypothetical protein [Escherichia coli]